MPCAAGSSMFLKVRYLEGYFELEKNENISSHLLVEICPFPESFGKTETIRRYQIATGITRVGGHIAATTGPLPTHGDGALHCSQRMMTPLPDFEQNQLSSATLAESAIPVLIFSCCGGY